MPETVRSIISHHLLDSRLAGHLTLQVGGDIYHYWRTSKLRHYYDIRQHCLERGATLPQPDNLDQLGHISNATGIDTPFFLNADNFRQPQSEPRWLGGSLVDKSIFNGTFDNRTSRYSATEVLVVTRLNPTIVVDKVNASMVPTNYKGAVVCEFPDYNKYVAFEQLPDGQEYHFAAITTPRSMFVGLNWNQAHDYCAVRNSSLPSPQSIDQIVTIINHFGLQPARFWLNTTVAESGVIVETGTDPPTVTIMKRHYRLEATLCARKTT